ncbi:class I SAM-dependent methyltransferase [Shewanella surugensis]|uniref:Class I SAM-dependent methyltransferase n=1 Tax=Shewanella surugensis TaxID=212020 RepID=A0ABT0LBT2_9GAMM|nr:class I SAM-dependent methyltransferase [Shewanella surugensis]MCL1125137.1 class I SAM-dependent methyltransferase [Shewanella surugensis]
MLQHTTVFPPQQWGELPNGESIRFIVEQTLAPWWPRIFGYYLLNLGGLSATMDKTGLSIQNEYSLYDADTADIMAELTHLPIQNSAIDAVVMNFLLEFNADPYRLLRELDRVLIAGGYLIIVGFNPISPLFLGKLLSQYQDSLPWSGRFFTPSRVKDWLGLLGYQVVSDDRVIHHHLLSRISKNNSLWQQGLKSWLPSSGSVYVIVARKLEVPLTPLQIKKTIKQPKWTTATAGRTGRVPSPVVKPSINTIPE